MKNKLHYNTVTPPLRKVLKDLMQAPELESFRLVGGTSLGLQRGHRESIDIDLFTDEQYGSIGFTEIDHLLHSKYPNVCSSNSIIVGMGKSYYIGTENESIKLDLFYSIETFIRPVFLQDQIRMATVEEIIAMKIDVVSRGGRKKDFWDLHELMEDYSFQEMLALHEERHPYTHNKELIKNNFSQFEKADQDFDPICLRNKYWELIKLDLIDFVG